MTQIVRKSADGSFLMLVLEPGNIHKLKEGQPIRVRVEDLFPDGIPKRLDIRIYFSETPIADGRELIKDAEVTLDERKAVRVTPHCPECKSTIEQFGILRNESPLAIAFCSVCGCIYGAISAKEIA